MAGTPEHHDSASQPGAIPFGTDPFVVPPSGEQPGDALSQLELADAASEPRGAIRSATHPDEMARRLDTVRAPCQELLEEALGKLESRTGVLYGVEGPRQLSLLGTAGLRDADGTGLPLIERAALAGLEACRPLLTGGGRTSGTLSPEAADVGALMSPTGERFERYLVVPCFLQGDVAAILLVERSTEATSMVEQDLARLGSTLSIALAADRARVHFTLERRLAEAEAVRRQLEAYAVDLRSVYLSERARSDELGRTLVELEETYEATVRGLAVAVEAKDAYTGGHLYRVSRYGMLMTSIIAPEHRDDPQFEYGFLLHDVGKLTVPDATLAKTGPLTEEEWTQIRAHPLSGRTILERIPFLAGAAEIVYSHHERWDGNGFPQGLRGEEIPLGARIFPIADAFDAMTTSRPYRKAMPMEIARAELVQASGTQFWPDAVEVFMSIPIAELEEIRSRNLGASGW